MPRDAGLRLDAGRLVAVRRGATDKRAGRGLFMVKVGVEVRVLGGLPRGEGVGGKA